MARGRSPSANCRSALTFSESRPCWTAPVLQGAALDGLRVDARPLPRSGDTSKRSRYPARRPADHGGLHR
eukprot:15461259-Alexandrium_andersonii.AAC.1